MCWSLRVVSGVFSRLIRISVRLTVISSLVLIVLPLVAIHGLIVLVTPLHCSLWGSIAVTRLIVLTCGRTVIITRIMG